MLGTLSVSILLTWLSFVVGTENRHCCDPSPAFPPPTYGNAVELRDAFSTIKASISNILEDPKYNTSSFSIEVTSSQETLWTRYHTAKERNETRAGTSAVTGDSVYRIASVTKSFTVLGILQQHAAGKLSLDDTIDRYVPELQKKQEGSIPWKDITLRSLASQLSGIPREFAQSDLITVFPDPTSWGLPPASMKGLPNCSYEIPCQREDLLKNVQARPPLFPPNQKSTYSNVAFELLGLAIANVTGLPYEDYVVSSILQPIGMESSSFIKPSDSVAVFPKGENYWDVDEGIQKPTGGLYASSADLSKYLRYILTHYDGITHALNWLQPASWSTGMNTFYGMPWEIFRTDKILNNTNRPVTFVTKSGGLPGYISYIMLLPDYDLGITILVGEDPASSGGDLPSRLRELISVQTVRAAETLAQKTLHHRYVGHYSSSTPNLNSSITLSHTPSRGLFLTSFISNGTDFLTTWRPLIRQLTGGSDAWRPQLVPTLLYRDQAELKGERWRMLIVPEGQGGEGVWDDFHITDDDPLSYAGKPLNEVVFWEGGGEGGQVEELEMTAFRVRMKRTGLSGCAGGSGFIDDDDEKGRHERSYGDQKQIPLVGRVEA